MQPNCLLSTHLHRKNFKNRKYSHSHAPPYCIVQPPSQSRQTNSHEQAVYRPKSSTRHTWGWRRWCLGVFGFSRVRCLILEYPLEHTETSREKSTRIPTKHIFSPNQFFTKFQRKSPSATRLSSRVKVLTKHPSTTSPFSVTTYTGNTTCLHPSNKPSDFSPPPRNKELQRKRNWA